MISTDFTIELSQWALSLERMRASVASENIANANITGTKKTINFEAIVKSMDSAIQSGNSDLARNVIAKDIEIEQVASDSMFGGVLLDAEVTDLSASQGRYKVIADSLSKKFGLMTLAVKGRE